MIKHLTVCVSGVMLLSGCISYGPQRSPSYPFSVVFYEDGSCELTASVPQEVQKTGWKVDGGVLNDSNQWNFADLECSDGYSEIDFSLYVKNHFDPGMVPGRYIRSEHDLIFSLSPTIENTRPSGNDYHPLLKDQYTATATSNMFYIPLRAYKVWSCGSKAYSKNGTAIIYSVENTAKTGIYAEMSGLMIAGGTSCW